MFVDDGRSQISSAQIYRDFRTAIREEDYSGARKAARHLPGRLSQIDALELTLLANEAGRQDEFEECAARWVARVTVEGELKLDAQAIAVQAFQAAGRGEAKDAFKRLVNFAKDT